MLKKILNYIGKKVVKICTIISPKLGSYVIYFMKTGKILNLKNPKEFNEKLMYLKLNNYNYNELVWKCSDKYLMRDYCYSCGIPKENMTEIIKIYDNAIEINFDELPNKFAIKCTNGQGFNIICEDKSKLNYKKAIKKLDKWSKTKFGYESAELHYTHIKPRIICEKFIETIENEYPIDYKFYCFNGIPKIILVCINRKKGYKTEFFDMEWRRQYFRENESETIIEKPKSFNEMVDIAKKISKEFPFVRIDLYEYNEKPVVGEMTFTPAACLGKYKKEASKRLGDMMEEFYEKE